MARHDEAACPQRERAEVVGMTTANVPITGPDPLCEGTARRLVRRERVDQARGAVGPRVGDRRCAANTGIEVPRALSDARGAGEPVRRVRP